MVSNTFTALVLSPFLLLLILVKLNIFLFLLLSVASYLLTWLNMVISSEARSVARSGLLLFGCAVVLLNSSSSWSLYTHWMRLPVRHKYDICLYLKPQRLWRVVCLAFVVLCCCWSGWVLCALGCKQFFSPFVCGSREPRSLHCCCVSTLVSSGLSWVQTCPASASLPAPSCSTQDTQVSDFIVLLPPYLLLLCARANE